MADISSNTNNRGIIMSQNEKKGRASALLPIIVFLLIFLGSGFITGDFYSMPAIVAFLIALVVAFAQIPCHGIPVLKQADGF